MKGTIAAIRARCEVEGDCWEWTGATDGSAPVLRIDGTRRLQPVRRVVLQLSGKPVHGLYAICSCRNPMCVSPKHTVAITRSELQYLIAKETQYGPRITRRAAIAAAKRKASDTVLTVDTVAEMRASGLSTRAAAARFGCGQTSAADAMAGRSWQDYRAPFTGMVGALTL